MRLVFILLIIGISWPSGVLGGQPQSTQEIFDDDNLLIVDMRLNNYILAEDLFVYANTEFALIPLQSFFDAIEFPILVDPTESTAEGWYQRTDRQFILDLNKKLLLLGDKHITIEESSLILNDGYDLYADIRLLEQWFPVELELRLSQLRLILETTEQLPIQKRIERENKRKYIDTSESETLAIIEDQYRWANWPVIDVSFNSSIQDRQENDSRAADTGYFLQSNGDLLKMQSSLSVSRQTLDEGSNARFTLQRKQSHPEKPLYSNLNAIALGDVFSVSDGLLFTSGSGLGVDLQFGQERTLSDFGKNIVEGFAAPGWEVEVYRNNVLLDFLTVGDDGRYRFEDLPLEYGENVFDIRLFGPQGQEESRREFLNIGNNALPEDEFYARLHYSNINQSVFSAAPSFSGEEDNPDSEQYGHFTFERGISNKLSLSLIAAEHTNPSDTLGNRNYFGGGFAYTFSRLAISGQRLSQLGDGTAHLLGMQSKLGNTSITFNHKQYHSFFSDRSDSGRLKKDSELRFNSYIGKFFSAPLTHQLLLNYEEAIDSQHLLTIENRIGFNWLGGRINWDNIYTSSNLDSLNNGSLRYLRTAGVKLNLRTSLQYETDDGFEITSANTSWNWHPQPDWNIQIGTATDFSGGDNNSITLSSAKKFSQALLSLDAALIEGGGGYIGINIEFSLSREDSKWKSQQRRQANFGRLRTQAYLDEDNDLTYSAGDTPLQAVRFEGINAWRELETNEQGVVYLNELRDSTTSRIKLDKGSLEDPFWLSQFDKAQVVSHAGGLIDLEISVQETLEIEGSLVMQLQEDGSVEPLPGIPVLLIDQSGQTKYESVSEFDGYFVLNSVLPGKYQLKIHPDALDKLGLQEVPPVALNLFDADGVIYLEPITLNRLLVY